MNVDNVEINRRIEKKHRLVPGKSALLVIDMQHGFLDEGASLEVAAGRAIIPIIRSLVDAFRAKGAPVIFTEFVYADNVPCLTGRPFRRGALARQGRPADRSRASLVELPHRPERGRRSGIRRDRRRVGPTAG